MTTYTEEEVKAAVEAAVAEAIAPLTTELTEFKSKVSADEVETKVAAARQEGEEKLADVQRQLDEKVLEAQTERKAREDLEAWLEDEATKAQTESEAAARRDDRVAKVTEVAAFDDDYVTANADRWSAMDDDAFAVYIEDLKVVASKVGESTKVPSKTAMTASRDSRSDHTAASGIQAVRALREQGIDPRSV